MRRRERGIAALTAILIVAVAATAATMMLTQQAAMLDQTMLVASRAQADQYAAAGLDWARGVLAQDARANTIDALDEGWARPIVGLPVERAVVAGAIADEQGKLNLNNLVRNRARSEPDVRMFGRLLDGLGLSPDLAEPLVDWMLPNGSDSHYLSLPRPYRAAKGPLTQVDELHRVRGYDAKIVEKLRPFVTALPVEAGDPPRINANTADVRVIAAACATPAEKLSPFIAERAKKPFTDKAALMARLQQDGCAPTNDPFEVKSGWFSILVRVQQDDILLGTEALVRRTSPQGDVALVWKRPRY